MILNRFYKALILFKKIMQVPRKETIGILLKISRNLSANVFIKNDYTECHFRYVKFVCGSNYVTVHIYR